MVLVRMYHRPRSKPDDKFQGARTSKTRAILAVKPLKFFYSANAGPGGCVYGQAVRGLKDSNLDFVYADDIKFRECSKLGMHMTLKHCVRTLVCCFVLSTSLAALSDPVELVCSKLGPFMGHDHEELIITIKISEDNSAWSNSTLRHEVDCNGTRTNPTATCEKSKSQLKLKLEKESATTMVFTSYRPNIDVKTNYAIDRKTGQMKMTVDWLVEAGTKPNPKFEFKRDKLPGKWEERFSADYQCR